MPLSAPRTQAHGQWADIEGMQRDGLRYLPIFRTRAAELRPGQEDKSWQELRQMVARLLRRMISEHRTEGRMVDRRPGVGIAACVALSDHEAALRLEDAVFFISSLVPWTALREAGIWRTPQDPDIVMIYARAPPGAVLH
jgi:hypothetical protein